MSQLLAYLEEGSGRPIVFLPGITCDKAHWEPVTALLADRFRCVRIDPPAHGDSDAPPADVFGQVDAVHEVVDHLGIADPILVGHSAGGLTSLVYAMLHPAAGVIVVDQPLDVAEFGSWVLALRDAWSDPDRFEAEFHSFVAEHFEPDLVPEERRSLLLDHVRPTQEVLLTTWAPILDGVEAAAAQLEAALPAVNARILLLYAHEPSTEERRLAGLIPDSTVEVIDGVGHFMMLVDPPRVAARIREFADSR